MNKIDFYISNMRLQIFLLLIFAFHPSTSAGKAPKLTKCTDIFEEYEASLDVASLLKEVSLWTMTIDKIPAMEYDVANDLEKCQVKVANLKVSEEQKDLAQHLIEAMQLHLTKYMAMRKLKEALMDCAKNAESKQSENERNMTSMNDSILHMTRKIESYKFKIETMKDHTVNLTKEMEQKGKEIIKWKVATFVLIGVGGLILGIIAAYFLLRRFKPQMVPHI